MTSAQTLFFTDSPMSGWNSKEKMEKIQALNWLREDWSDCRACNLCQERTNTVFGYGNPDASVMIIGEAPGQNEDESGLPFVGAAGQLLDQYLAQVSARDEVQEIIDRILSDRKMDSRLQNLSKLRDKLLDDYYFTNVVMCRPPDNRDPTPKEIEACRARLYPQIYTVDPVLIITAGRVATEALVGKKLSITQVRGDIFDVEIPGFTGPIRYPVMAVLHPSFLLRKNDFKQKGGDGVKTYNDFVRAMNIIDAFNLRHHELEIPPNRPRMET
jgi:uracil-DNA glycosylase family 4